MNDPVLWMVFLVGAGLVLVLAYPLLSPREPWDLDEAPDRLRNLQRARHRALRTLKDIESDHREGILLDEDYRQIQATYKRQAIQLSKELARVRESVIRRIQDGPGGRAPSDRERDVLERMIEKRKKRHLSG